MDGTQRQIDKVAQHNRNLLSDVKEEMEKLQLTLKLMISEVSYVTNVAHKEMVEVHEHDTNKESKVDQ